MESELFFSSGELTLEGLITRGTAGRGVVVTHPHPLYGGDMHNPVVTCIGNAYAKLGYTVLKFNFRGVGSSTGRYDDGNGERADLAAAISFLKEEGLESVDVAGYSFGAWIAAGLLGGEKPSGRMIMVAPAVAFLDFTAAGSLPGLSLVIAGEMDHQFAPAGRIREMMPHWNPDACLEVIDGADHFFHYDGPMIEELILSYLESPS